MKLIMGFIAIFGLFASCLYHLGGDVYRAWVIRYSSFLRSFRKIRDGASGLHHLYMGAPGPDKRRQNEIFIPERETAL